MTLVSYSLVKEYVIEALDTLVRSILFMFILAFWILLFSFFIAAVQAIPQPYASFIPNFLTIPTALSMEKPVFGLGAFVVLVVLFLLYIVSHDKLGPITSFLNWFTMKLADLTYSDDNLDGEYSQSVYQMKIEQYSQTAQEQIGTVLFFIAVPWVLSLTYTGSFDFQAITVGYIVTGVVIGGSQAAFARDPVAGSLEVEIQNEVMESISSQVEMLLLFSSGITQISAGFLGTGEFFSLLISGTVALAAVVATMKIVMGIDGFSGRYLDESSEY